MWNLVDLEADALCDMLARSYDGCESAVFTALSAWFRKLAGRLRSEVNREGVVQGQPDEFERCLVEMQRELHALSGSRAVRLPPQSQLSGTRADRVPALLEELAESLEYLAAHPEFAKGGS